MSACSSVTRHCECHTLGRRHRWIADGRRHRWSENDPARSTRSRDARLTVRIKCASSITVMSLPAIAPTGPRPIASASCALQHHRVLRNQRVYLIWRVAHLRKDLARVLAQTRSEAATRRHGF